MERIERIVADVIRRVEYLKNIDQDRYSLHLEDEITVCDSCYRAGCWAGIWYCDDARDAGTKQITVRSALEWGLESPGMWLELRKAEGY